MKICIFPWEKGTSPEKMSPPAWLVASLCYIFLINDWFGRAQLLVGGITLGVIVLSIRNKAEEVMMSKTVHSTLWPLLLFLAPGSRPHFPGRWTTGRKMWNKAFPPQVTFGPCCFGAAIAMLTKTNIHTIIGTSEPLCPKMKKTESRLPEVFYF